ncbi:hypothetical protein [Streptomyces sp. NPDC093225]|uniref:hypothetical protein n=1 Tax=Streptomyces sp. NPDC093225 TaxID=3366034 RepID=UPI00380564F5
MTDDRCPAAHDDDETPCAGPHDAVTIRDEHGTESDACEIHGPRMLASITGATVWPGSVPDAATRVHAAAGATHPFPWLLDAPRTRPDQLAHTASQAHTPD